MNVTKPAVLAAIGLVALAAPAIAQNADADYRRFCAADYQRFCATFTPGSPEVEACMRQNLDAMSKGCRDTILKYNPNFRKR